MTQEWATRSRLPDEAVPDEHVRRRGGRRRLHQRPTADRDQHRLGGRHGTCTGRRCEYRGGFAAGAQGSSKPVGEPPGTFTITAVQPERMWASETGFRSAICVARTATRRLADGKIRDRKWTRRTARSVPLFSMARGGRELAQCGIRIAVDLDEEMFGPGRFPIHLPAARAPNGIRTRAAALKGRCPRPLDDGGVAGFGRRGRHQPAVGTAPA